ncbi:MAG: glutaredoxin family protein [Candidatus Nanopelagicales bacterium]
MSERVVLYTKPGCHLCDVAREVVEIVCAELDTDYAEVDIWDDPSDADRFADRIPVVVVDGAEIAHFRVDPTRLRAALGESR